MALDNAIWIKTLKHIEVITEIKESTEWQAITGICCKSLLLCQVAYISAPAEMSQHQGTHELVNVITTRQ